MNQENITRTLATGQSDITRHEAYTKAQGLNEFNSLTPGYDHKLLITLHYCDIGGTRVLIDPQVKHKYGSNTPYYDIYDCGTCTTANGTGILTLTYSDGKLQVYPYFFNPAEFNSSFEKVVDNVRYISNSIDTPNLYRPTYESIEDFIQQLVTIRINYIEFTKEANSIYFVNNNIKIKGEAWSPKRIQLYYVSYEGVNFIVTKDGVMQIPQYIISGYGPTNLNVVPVFTLENNALTMSTGRHSEGIVVEKNSGNQCDFSNNCAINSYYCINGLPSNMINMNFYDFNSLLKITITIEDINGIQHSIDFNHSNASLVIFEESSQDDIIFTFISFPYTLKKTITLRQTPYSFQSLGGIIEIAQDANGPLIFPYICGPTYLGTIDISMYGGYVYYAKRRDEGTRDLLYVNDTYKEWVDNADPLLLNNATLMAITDFNNLEIDIVIDGEPFYKPIGSNILLHRTHGTDYEIIETLDV